MNAVDRFKKDYIKQVSAKVKAAKARAEEMAKAAKERAEKLASDAMKTAKNGLQAGENIIGVFFGCRRRPKSQPGGDLGIPIDAEAATLQQSELELIIPDVEAAEATPTATEATEEAAAGDGNDSDTDSLPGPGKKSEAERKSDGKGKAALEVTKAEAQAQAEKEGGEEEEKTKKKKTPEEFSEIEELVRGILDFHKTGLKFMDKKGDEEKLMADTHFVLDQYAVAIFVTTYVITVCCIFLA